MLGSARDRKPSVVFELLAKRNLIGRRALEQRKDAVKANALTKRALVGALRHIERVAQIVKRDVTHLDIGDIERRILNLRRITRLNPQYQLRALAQIHVSVVQSERLFGPVLQAHVVVQVARTVIGHHDQLHGFALATIRKGDVVGHDRQRRGHGHVGVLGRTALVKRRARLRKVIGVGDRQQVIARNVPVLLGRKRHRCVANAHTADHERRAARDAEDGHKGTFFVPEQIARGHLVQKAHAAPNKADALEENARAGARGLGAHERSRGLGHLVAAGDNRGAHHAHGKQRHRNDRGHDVVRKQHLGQRVHVVEHRKQEQRQAHKAKDIAEHATDQTGPQRVVHVFGQNAPARIAKRLVQANERALFLDHARGGGKADEHGNDKEDEREYGGNGLDRRTIALDARVACDIAAVLDVPGAFAQVRKLGAGIGELLVGSGAALV